MFYYYPNLGNTFLHLASVDTRQGRQTIAVSVDSADLIIDRTLSTVNCKEGSVRSGLSFMPWIYHTINDNSSSGLN